MPLDGEIEVAVGHVNPVAGLELVLGGIGAEPPTGDADPAQDGHSQHRRSCPDQGCLADLAGGDGREQYVVGHPADHQRRHDGHRREQERPGTANGELFRGAVRLAGDQSPAASEEGALGPAGSRVSR